MSAEHVYTLCRIYTRYEWPAERSLIREQLSRAGRSAGPGVEKHLEREKGRLPAVTAEIERLMGNSVKERVKWRYDRARAVDAALRSGTKELEAIVP